MLLEFLPLHCSINKGKVVCLGSFYATSLCFSSFFLFFPLPLPSPDRLFIRILDLSQYRSCSTFAFKENPPPPNLLLRPDRPRSARAAPWTLAFLCEYVRSGANLWNVQIPHSQTSAVCPANKNLWLLVISPEVERVWANPHPRLAKQRHTCFTDCPRFPQ